MQKAPAISNPDCLESPAISNKYLPNQGIVFFARSDWLLKLGIVFAIHLPASFWISQANILHIFPKKRSCLVLAIHWFGIYTKIIIHLSVGNFGE